MLIAKISTRQITTAVYHENIDLTGVDTPRSLRSSRKSELTQFTCLWIG